MHLHDLRALRLGRDERTFANRIGQVRYDCGHFFDGPTRRPRGEASGKRVPADHELEIDSQ